MWGTASSNFLKVDDLESVIIAISLAASPKGRVETNDYNEVRVVWIEQGGKLLDYIDSNSIDQLVAVCGELEDLDSVEDLRTLLTNMKNLSREWRTSIDDDGSLRFYIDVVY
jgi:hypothetical protein